MNWLARALIGPGFWATGFASAYALHGLGCAQGWSEVDVGPVSLHMLAMGLVWLATMSACALALYWLPTGPDLPRSLPRAGAWIGLGATAFSLLPLVAASSC